MVLTINCFMRWVGWEECKLGYGQVRNKIFILILSDCFIVFNINQVNEQINNSHAVFRSTRNTWTDSVRWKSTKTGLSVVRFALVHSMAIEYIRDKWVQFRYSNILRRFGSSESRKWHNRIIYLDKCPLQNKLSKRHFNSHTPVYTKLPTSRLGLFDPYDMGHILCPIHS